MALILPEKLQVTADPPSLFPPLSQTSTEFTLGVNFGKQPESSSTASLLSQHTAKNSNVYHSSSLRRGFSARMTQVQEEDETESFEEKSHFLTCHGMKLHPYQGEAPYMQAYEPVLLDNDRYTEILLRRLNPTGTPIFTSPRHPPSTVLDLGCGRGRWILDAAAFWKSHGTKFTGFDLVDLSSEWLQKERLSVENVEFIRGNFLKYRLPFPECSFDLVRMANLSLCIPCDKWEFVIGEVHRVLTPGGRLEFIDDQILFPYGNPPASPSTHTTSSHGRCAKVPSASVFETDSDQDDRLTDEGIDMTLPHVEAKPTSHYSLPQIDHYSHWKSQVKSSKALETVFGHMLRRFCIHSEPHTFILDLLRLIFGRKGAKKLCTSHLSLVPAEPREENKDSRRSSKGSTDSGFASGSGSSGKTSLFTIEWDKKDEEEKGTEKRRRKLKKSQRLKGRSSDENLMVRPLQQSSKGTRIKDDSCANMVSPSTRAQSPGLVVWPVTFLPLQPFELEMHVCKYMHVLLGCKPALADFIAQLKDKNGGRLIGEAHLKDLIWDYESFRRSRFNWPSDVPEMRMDESTSQTQDKTDSRPPSYVKYQRDFTHVRTIRVFEAVKFDYDATP